MLVPPRRKVWKLRDPSVGKDYKTSINEKYTELFSNKKAVGVNDGWSNAKTCFLKGVDQVRSWICSGRVQYAEWWSNGVDQYVKEKRRLRKLWKVGGFRTTI